MLVSMTGFSNAVVPLTFASGESVTLAIELKSINSRFFEALCKLPSALNHLEVPMISLLQKKLLRGRIYLTVRFEGADDPFQAVVPSLKTVQSYLTAAKTIKETCNVGGELGLVDLFMLPNVVAAGRSCLHSDDESAILQVIDAVADRLVTTRQEEGTVLERDFVDIFARCATKIAEINHYFNEFLNQKKEALNQQIALSTEGNEQAKAVIDDLYSTLNKIDIHEEITRFQSHLASVKAFLAQQQIDKGKRFDFILQELLREINTIMAKCSSFDISSRGIDIKVELEKAREQIQNIV